MLNAWLRGKRRDRRCEYEDEIVSAIFGTVRYLPSPQRAKIFRAILNNAFEHSDRDVARIKKHETCRIELWQNLVTSGRIEPDIEVRLLCPASRTEDVILIEAKWNSPQSDKQLATQWQAAKRIYKNKEQTVWHIFMTKDSYGMEDMLGTLKEGEHSSHLANITWSRLAFILHEIKNTGTTELKSWAQDVCTFLGVLGQSRFEGFPSVVTKHREWDAGGKWYFRPALFRITELVDRYKESNNLWSTPVWQFSLKTIEE